MRTALIGHSGFVGGNLAAQTAFDDCYNSKNIEDLAGRSYDLLICSGAPAAKWIANKNPEQDWENLSRLIGALDQVEAKSVVLISTVDVYAKPLEVNESDTGYAALEDGAYGFHRRRLETFVQERFSDATVIRLPGLFGQGLKKNVIYDFLNDNCLDMIHPGGVFQFYNLEYLWSDIQKVREAGIRVINFAVEPTSVREIAQECFGFTFENNKMTGPGARYDFRTLHSAPWGRTDGYLYGKDQVKADITRFVQTQREVAACN